MTITLPHGRPNQLDIISPQVKAFLQGDDIHEEKGFIQVKAIDQKDNKLEIVPQRYLDNPDLKTGLIDKEVRRLYAEVLFGALREKLK